MASSTATATSACSSRSSASSRRRRRLALAAAALLAAGAPAARAQECRADGPRPVVCDVELRIGRAGDRLQRVDPGRPIQIPAGEAVDVEVTALDGSGREFPADRVLYGLDLDRDCRGDLRVSGDRDVAEGRFRVTAGAQRGGCTAYLWIPGNLNLEWPLRFEVVSRARDGYSREEASFIAARLYEAILGRPGDGPGLDAATMEIQRGRLGDQVWAMVQSPEFRQNRSGLSANALLGDVYGGLLGRTVDSGAVRTYLSQVERGRLADVVIAIVRSEEFETYLFGKVGSLRK